MSTRRHESLPSVYRFLDAREFLRLAYERRRLKDKGFSQRRIANALKAGSSSFFLDIVTGKSKLTPSRVAGFARLFGLNEVETVYFERLAAYTQATDDEDRKVTLARLKDALPFSGQKLTEAYQAEYFGKWHYAAVRELIALHPFRGNYAELAELLDPPITPVAAREAIDLLLRLKLIRKTAQGIYERADKVIVAGADTGPERIRPALLDHIRLARRALDRHQPPDRPFSYLTLSVSESALREIRIRMRTFRDDVFAIVAREQDVDRLYHMNLQLFPISKVVKRRAS
jgi:uncharacterized protein (TIGR02147 family)